MGVGVVYGWAGASGPGANEEQACMAVSQVAASTPGGGPVTGPGDAGTPCWPRQ